MIFLIGDTPSKKNDVVICNKDDIELYRKLVDILLIKAKGNYDECYHGYDKQVDKLVALGNNVSKFLKEHGIEHYKLDHPSGKNRKFNDPKYEKQMLKELKEWLKS
jgi:hypothetical protein